MYQITQDKFLDTAEFSYLKNLISDDKNIRDRLMIELLMSTGARATELLNLTTDSLSTTTKGITIISIKGIKNSKDRSIPLKPKLAASLKKYISELKSGERIFPISYKRLQQIWHNYRPTKKGIHSLRHTFAINLYRKTKDIKLVQNALGHKSINNTLVYVDFCSSLDDLCDALI